MPIANSVERFAEQGSVMDKLGAGLTLRSLSEQCSSALPAEPSSISCSMTDDLASATVAGPISYVHELALTNLGDDNLVSAITIDLDPLVTGSVLGSVKCRI